MASTKQTIKPTFKERWDEDIKWHFSTGLLTIPSGIAVFILCITVVNLYTGWF